MDSNEAPGQRFFFGDLVNRPFHPDTYRIFDEGRLPNLPCAEIERQWRLPREIKPVDWSEWL